MCGRFTQLASPEDLRELFELDELPVLPGPRYNLVPGQEAAVILLEDGRRCPAMLHWGLRPKGHINARSETAAVRPRFRHAFAARRCLVPVNGFYEWMGRGQRRQPWLFRMQDRRPFALAGLWERWRHPASGSPAGARGRSEGNRGTFIILTTAANRFVARVHHRMPLIVPPEEFEDWLALGPLPEATIAGSPMEAHPVRRLVGDPRHDGPECTLPVSAAELRRRQPPGLFDKSPGQKVGNA